MHEFMCTNHHMSVFIEVRAVFIWAHITTRKNQYVHVHVTYLFEGEKIERERETVCIELILGITYK